jgi:hypothetical protein
MTTSSLPSPSTSNLHTFRQLLRENQNSLLNPSPGEIPSQLHFALDEIESPVVREHARVLFGEIVASRRAGTDSGAREKARSWFERLLLYLEGPALPSTPVGAH